MLRFHIGCHGTSSRLNSLKTVMQRKVSYMDRHGEILGCALMRGQAIHAVNLINLPKFFGA